MSKKTGVLLIQLGSPKSPEVADVKAYLKDFLGDPRVVDANPLLWKIILNLFVLPTRSPKSAEAYREIWTGETFPLFKNTKSFSDKLKAIVDDEDLIVRHSYIISEPQVQDVIGELKAEGCSKIRVIPMFPQYCEATTLSCKDQVDFALEKHGDIEIDFVESYHDNEAYINSFVRRINAQLKEKPVQKLLMSFHGYPIRRVRNGDRYFDECMNTANLIAERVEGIAKEDIILTFQSKFGREPWLEPGTEETLIELAEQGIKDVAVVCPAFVVDNLETEEEVGLGLNELFVEKSGGNFTLITCPNDDDEWVKDFRDQLIRENTGKTLEVEKECLSKPDQPCCAAKVHCKTCPYKGMAKHPDGSLSPTDRGVLKAMFVTLFLDLVGFSIIFPLFPQMLEYYRDIEQGTGGLFTTMMKPIQEITGATSGHSVTALFAGVLTFIYSFLQFFMAPIFGTISDRIGRRPLLLFSITGIAISYLVWFFSGSFLLLVISRLMAGLMGSNITTATAAVADVTNEKTRSKGMAFIGIAFGLGFILGPAIGGLSAYYFNLAEMFPSLEKYGVNPFSAPALVAFFLAVYNLTYVIRKFPETLPPEKRGKGQITRTVNPMKLFHMESYPGVSKTVWAHFIFLAAFSGAETVLTFLTVERLGFTAKGNGLMFVYIGFIIAMVQGGYVRRKAHDVGEANMARKGLTYLVPSLICVALAGYWNSTFVLFIGLFLMAFGSAMAIPCLTSLASLYTPATDQGRVLGVFRSLGAFARTIGPLAAGVLYWKWGYQSPYYFSAVVILIPIIMVMGLPKIEKKES